MTWCLTEYLHRNPLEPHRLSAPKPSRSSPATYTWTFWNLTEYQKPPEASPAFRNLKKYLHGNPREPLQASPGVKGAPDGTRSNLGYRPRGRILLLGNHHALSRKNKLLSRDPVAPMQLQARHGSMPKKKETGQKWEQLLLTQPIC